MPESGIYGAAQLAELARTLREAGEKDLARELTAGVAKALEAAPGAVRESALAILPRAGGLNERVAASKVTTRRSKSSVRVVASSDYDLKAIDRGRVKHPVFRKKGRKDVWVIQIVPAGWFTRPLRALAPAVAAAIEKAARDVAGRIHA